MFIFPHLQRESLFGKVFFFYFHLKTMSRPQDPRQTSVFDQCSWHKSRKKKIQKVWANVALKRDASKKKKNKTSDRQWPNAIYTKKQSVRNKYRNVFKTDFWHAALLRSHRWTKSPEAMKWETPLFMRLLPPTAVFFKHISHVDLTERLHLKIIYTNRVHMVTNLSYQALSTEACFSSTVVVTLTSHPVRTRLQFW